MSTISVVVPAYNEQRSIASCLQSILAQHEMRGCYEVLVINNASTDATSEIVQRDFPEVRLINEPRKGLAIAYNRGASEAKGDIVKFVDADCVLPKEHLRKILYEFNSDEKLVAISGPYIYKDGGTLCDLFIRSMYLLVAMPLEMILNRLFNVRSSIASGNLAVRKDAFHKVNGFNERLFYGIEPDIAMKLKRLGKVRFKLSLSLESSSRRLKKEGAIYVVAKHMFVNIAPNIFSKQFSKTIVDIR